jgi:hypothetical protein
MDSGRYSPSSPAMPELPDEEEETTDLQADVQDAIDNLEHIDQIESGLDEAASAVIGLEGVHTDHQMGGQSSSEQEVFHDATAQEAELEQEIAQLPDAAATSLMGEAAGQYTQTGGSSEDADAEGEIDMDLGDEDESEQPLPVASNTYSSNYDDPNIDPALLGIDAEVPAAPPSLPIPQATASAASASNTSTPIPVAPESTSTSNTPTQPEQRQRDNRSASPARPAPTRRRPGQQRRSPSYSLDAAPAAPNPIPTPASTSNNPIVAPGSRAGLPVKPVTGPTPPSAGRRNEPRHYAPRFSFEGVEFPEGIQVSSPSVMAHQALASSWVESEYILTIVDVLFGKLERLTICGRDHPGKENKAANAQASLAMFEAARSDGDVEGARSWYQAFSKDNPTAVSLDLHANIIYSKREIDKTGVEDRSDRCWT